jgi:hypothetical protein
VLRELQDEVEVHHVTELGLTGALDTEVIPYCKKNGFVLVTEDQNIRRNPHEVAALKSAGIGFIEVRISSKAGLLARHAVYVSNLVGGLTMVVSQQPPFCYVMTKDGLREDGVGRLVKKARKRK